MELFEPSDLFFWGWRIFLAEAQLQQQSSNQATLHVARLDDNYQCYRTLQIEPGAQVGVMQILTMWKYFLLQMLQ